MSKQKRPFSNAAEKAINLLLEKIDNARLEPTMSKQTKHFEFNSFAKMDLNIDVLLEELTKMRAVGAFHYVDFEQIRSELHSIKRNLYMNRPYKECSTCDGNGCRFCDDLGWLRKGAT